ncbi:MAG: hypothetical protein ACI9F9_003042 [Candidatus Paceibacteria bacterium]|jgi:hypothetical protein
MKQSIKSGPLGWLALLSYVVITSAALAPVISAPGGTGTLGGPIAGLDAEQLGQFNRGRDVFDRDFHRSTGLGAPEMNADSCRACHQDPVMGGAGGLELNVSRFGDDNGGLGRFMDLPGGQGLSKLHPPFVPLREECNELATVFEQRQTPSTLGLGLVSRIPDYVITANEDSADSNGDGIYGVARRVNVNGVIEIGKFGWKAQLPRVTDFGRDAMLGECGITTPDDGRNLTPNEDSDTVSDPELSFYDFEDLKLFQLLIAPPLRTGSTAPEVLAGELLFDQIGCATCHIPSLEGHAGPVDLYSNLLLHDVMPVDFRGMAEDGAGVGMYRTSPLWGIKHTAPYMHDGRAEDLDGAIRAHFSEAEDTRVSYEGLTEGQRADLIAFLNDL